ncbi:MAG: class F sortase [Acidimicrobiaceae bacterium]|nr:class F sortase [Acidimicrobiaceae bacterium]
MQAPNPAVIRIPRLEVEASIIPLGLQEDGSIEVPEDPDQAGWWLGGPEPGETGPAVILGHVDSQEEGPAVFFYLQYLDPGDEIHIDRVDGSTITYVVESTERHDKDEFPTDAVYGPTEAPTLRLVTCGGDFDFGVRTYEDNVIVFASLA